MRNATNIKALVPLLILNINLAIGQRIREIRNNVDICKLPTRALFRDTVKSFVTNSSKELDFFYRKQSLSCSKPTIKFEEKTLLGFSINYGGCSLVDIRNYLEIDKTNKLYIYTVKIETEGPCCKLGGTTEWVEVPKIPKGWRVHFKSEVINDWHNE